jgi:hypothetical protein
LRKLEGSQADERKSGKPWQSRWIKVQQRRHRQTGIVCKTKVTIWIRANYPGSHAESRFSRKETQEKRALLCKLSRDEDSRKPFLAVMPNQGLAERRHRRNGHCYANRTDIYGKPTLGLVRYSSGEWEEKGNCEKMDERQDTDTDSTGRQGLIKFARPRTSHFTPRRAVGQPTRLPPPPRCFAPPPPHQDLAVKSHTKLRSPLRPRRTGDSFSVQQPCELHLWQPPVVMPGRPQPASWPPRAPPLTPHSVADLTRTS